MSARTTRARAIVALGLLVVFFAVAIASRLSAGARAVTASDRALATGDRMGAIEQARLAAEALAPGSPYPERGYARLDGIARDAETRDDDETAAAAWRAMRTAAIATRGLGVSSDHELARANEGIARTATRVRGAARADRPREEPGTPSLAEKRLLETLARDDTPPVRVFALLGAGALLFFAAVARLLTLDALDGTRARLAGAATVLGFVLAAFALASAR